MRRATTCSPGQGDAARKGRLVVTGDQARLYLVKLDQSTGALTMDNAFHDAIGKPGFDFAIESGPWVDGRRGATWGGLFKLKV